MLDATTIERIRDKYIAMALHLDERGRRRWAAAEARDLGWGGISAVANATGISDRTIRSGTREIEDPSPLSPVGSGGLEREGHRRKSSIAGWSRH